MNASSGSDLITQLRAHWAAAFHPILVDALALWNPYSSPGSFITDYRLLFELSESSGIKFMHRKS